MSGPKSGSTIKVTRADAEKAYIKNKAQSGADNNEEEQDTEDSAEGEDEQEDSGSGGQDNKPQKLSFLEVLPSPQGTVLATDLANILTMGMTPQQENVLGNFLTAVSSLILYKAASDQIAEDLQNKK